MQDPPVTDAAGLFMPFRHESGRPSRRGRSETKADASDQSFAKKFQDRSRAPAPMEA